MTLTVEDGTGVSGANSYVGLVELRAFASSHGVALPVGDDACSVLLVGSADYLNVKQWQGSPKTSEQYLAWPRTEVYFEDILVTIIPNRVKQAQLHLALEIQQNGALLPALRPSLYRRTKIDVMSLEYNKLAETGAPTTLPVVEALIKPFLSNQAAVLTTVRG